MKTTSHVIPLAIAALVGVVALFGQSPNSSPSKELMRAKLDHAQSVLEALTLEDFDLLRAHAGRLRALSEQPSWNLFNTAEYAEQSLVFRRNVDGLLRAARQQNLDAATLAYTKVTFSCVECHKYIRDRKGASSN